MTTNSKYLVKDEGVLRNRPFLKAIRKKLNPEDYGFEVVEIRNTTGPNFFQQETIYRRKKS